MQSAIQDIVRQVEALATPLVEEEGIELWGVDLRQEAGRWVLRLALDREGGVTLDDLTRVHRQLSDLLDVHDLVPWRYTLEVSSPGINRPLLRPSHYRRYLGKRVRIQTRNAQHGRRVFVGPLGEVGEAQVSLVDSDVGEVRIPWEEVRKATAEHEFPAPGGKKKGAQR
ncbi:MAG: ribosome maturation factor RimP [Deltaproteobacteria bacterium]|nr:ribosome maturation factor RimP [Deltaproteobacteria bacterium]